VNRTRIPKRIWPVVAIVMAMCAQPLLACAVCYGQSDSPLARAMNWGIVTLLAVVASVLGGITMFFVHVGRRSGGDRAANPDESPNSKN